MNIAVVTDDTIGTYMGAGGLRLLHIAKYLKSTGHLVTLFCQSNSGESTYDGFKTCQPESFNTEFVNYDLAIAGTLTRRGLHGLKRFGKPIIHDLICPFMLENRHALAHLPYLKRVAWEREFNRDFLTLAKHATTWLVASDRQRRFWMGYFEKAGILEETYNDSIPFIELPNGIETNRIASSTEWSRPTKALVDAIESEPDRANLITNGGMYGWFQYEPLLKAFAQLIKEGYKTRLILLGAKHPSHPEQSTGVSSRIASLIKELSISEQVCISDWLPHYERFEVLKRASLGINIHRQGAETELSYRNRLLDFASCEVPLITSTGDIVSERMIDAGLAIPIVGLDISNICEVMKRALDAKWGNSYHIACVGFRNEWDWSRVVVGINVAIETALRMESPFGISRERLPDVYTNLYCCLRTFFRQHFRC